MTERVDAETLKSLVLQAIPDAQVQVKTYSGDDHFEMEVVSKAFSGKSRIAQHQMVYAALGDYMRQAVHALALTTRTS